MRRHRLFQVLFDTSSVSAVLTAPVPRGAETTLALELVRLAHDRRPAEFLFDFNGARHCSKELINALLQVQKHLSSIGCQLRLCGLSRNIQETLELTKLDRVLAVAS